MTLSGGLMLGPYEVLAPLGAGGMGEVYRARDTRLGREVAIKVLPSERMADEALRRRFVREARAASSLNHPNIVTIHDIDSVDGIDFIVMECVPGKVLGAHMQGRALPVAVALHLGAQLADALARAHAAGIVHRDLKPSNVMVTSDGGVKVLDFGLAKLVMPPKWSEESGTLTQEPREPLTNAGGIAGTPGYLSPEQATGGEADARSDIFSFGALLYEMVTGRRAFPGGSAAEAVGAVVHDDPKPLREVVPGLPKELERLVLRCLRKDPDRRFQSMADVKLELLELAEESEAQREPAAPSGRPTRFRLAALALGGLGVASAVTLGVWLRGATPAGTPTPGARMSLALPPGEPIVGMDYPSLALSPDGSQLAYVAPAPGGQHLLLRALREIRGTPIPGTDGARGPFFSPDGQWVGFFAGGKLKKVSVRGGEPASLCNAANGHGASWGNDGRIVFAAVVYSGLSEVSADGGTPRAITTLDVKKGERAHRWPELLPGGDAVIFTAWTGARWEDSRIVAQSLRTGERRVLIQGGASARYVPGGYLVYVRASTLMAAPFDSQRLEVTGSPVTIVEGVRQAGTGAAQFALAGPALLVHVPGGLPRTERSLVLVDRQGKSAPLPVPPGSYFSPRLSPDGRRLAVEVAGAHTDLYVYDLADGRSTRLTFEASNTFPVWTPDGTRVAFQSNRGGPLNIYWKPADGSGPEERLTTGDYADNPCSWSPDGKLLAYHQVHPETGRDLWVLPIEGERRPRLFLSGSANEGTPAFSPNGRWLAYTSDESGGSEVYVKPFPGPGGRWQISTEGGTEPVWARSGKEIFYWHGERMMAVSIASGDEFTAAKPVFLFEGHYDRPVARPNYDVTPDGRRFVMIKGNGQELSANQLSVVLGWLDSATGRGGLP